MLPIIDTHSHYMPPAVAEKTAFFKVNWSDIDRHLSLMDKAKIEKSILLYPTSDAHIQMGGWLNLCNEYNHGISDAISSHSDRFIGAGIIPVDSPEKIPAELDKFLDLDLKVISLASSYDGVYLSDEKFFSVYEFAQKHHMPVHVHSQIINPIGEERVRDPLLSPVLEYVFDVTMCIGQMMMNETFSKFPDVNFIFAHYGGVLPLVKERFDTTYTMLRKRDYVKDLKKNPSEFFKNIYIDTSGSKSAASLLCALEIVDASHILYGSDFPANQSYDFSMRVIEDSPLDGSQTNQILRDNILNLINLQPA